MGGTEPARSHHLYRGLVSQRDRVPEIQYGDLKAKFRLRRGLPGQGSRGRHAATLRRRPIVPHTDRQQPGNLGQSPVWYGKDDKFRKSVLAYVEAGGKRHQPDPDLRRRIEEAAVEHATLYYESAEGGKRSVVSVERNARGWDLEASGFDGSMLKVEVKGLQGRQVVAELTPNEYSKMLDPEHRRDYVIYIVTQALEKVPKSHVFRYDAERSKSKSVVWVTDDDRKLVIEPIVAARVSC